MLTCDVKGDDSPEAGLRQVDEHALRTMYCAMGCDYAVNHAIPHAFSTYIKPICSVEKEENQIEFKKYEKDGKDSRRRRSLRWERGQRAPGKTRRDIDAYTVGSAQIKFCCTDQSGVDYTEAVSMTLQQAESIVRSETADAELYLTIASAGGQENRSRAFDLQGSRKGLGDVTAILPQPSIEDTKHIDYIDVMFSSDTVSVATLDEQRHSETSLGGGF